MRLFVAAFVFGVFALQQATRLPSLGIAAAGALALAAAFVMRGLRWRLPLLFSAGLLLGAGHAAWQAGERLAEALPFALEGRDVSVRGIVASLPQVGPRGVRFLLHVEQGAAIPEWIALTWYRDGGGNIPAIAAGQRWAFNVRLKRPRGLSNPHGFEFEAWALERDIRATGYVRTAGESGPRDESVPGWPQTLHRWRGAVRDRVTEALAGQRYAGVVTALAIGDQDAIASQDWDVFWATGVGHLMSISGLHITMFAALACAVTYFLWVRSPYLVLRVPARKAALVVGMLAAFAYTLMTGYAVPAQRTFIMLAVVATCVLADRHGSPSRVLALAALAVLLVDPWAVMSSGFWLSFGAVAAIFFALGARTGHASKWQAAWGEQASVTLAMAPMMLALFQQLSLVSPLANAFAIPVVSLAVVPLAIAGAFLDLPSLLGGAHQLLAWLMVPLEAMAQWEGATWETHAPPAWAVVTSLIGCAWLLAPRGVPLRSFGLAWIAPLVVLPAPHPATGEAWIDALDVGQGLAVVVRTENHALLFDAGPSWQSENDSGERIVVPYLRGEGIRTLDALVVSHRDDDHSGGAASVILRRSPAWMLTSLPETELLRRAVDPSYACVAGQRWRWDGVEFRVLGPMREAYQPDRGTKENDRSCVLRVATAGGIALLTADVEAKGEAAMLRRDRGALRADVLFVPHHGSRTSSSEPFLAAVAPQVGVVSLGFRNRFGHPNATVVARYEAHGIPLRRTDLEGALRVVLPNGGRRPSVEPLLPEVPYWSDRGP
jgi:competence protein ComEC